MLQNALLPKGGQTEAQATKVPLRQLPGGCFVLPAEDMDQVQGVRHRAGHSRVPGLLLRLHWVFFQRQQEFVIQPHPGRDTFPKPIQHLPDFLGRALGAAHGQPLIHGPLPLQQQDAEQGGFPKRLPAQRLGQLLAMGLKQDRVPIHIHTSAVSNFLLNIIVHMEDFFKLERME